MARDVMMEKLDQILTTVMELEQRVGAVERKLDVIALRLLAPDECAALGIGAPQKKAAVAGGRSR